jgi:hypothetical protein
MTADDLIKVVLEMRQKEPRYIYPKKPHKAASARNDRQHFINSLLQTSRPVHHHGKLGNPVSRAKRLATLYAHDDYPKHTGHSDDHFHYHHGR